MYMQKYGIAKTWLDNFLKSLILEDTSTSTMVNRLKHG